MAGRPWPEDDSMTDFNDRRPVQRRLPGVDWRKEAPLGKPHERSFESWAKNPRTVWHASMSKQSPTDSGRADQYAPEGFHVGTLQAAIDRGALNDRPLHPLRIRPGTLPRFGYGSTDSPIDDQEESWGDEHHNKWYRNRYEDQGSLSAITDTASRTQSFIGAALEGSPAERSGDARRALHEYKRTGQSPHYYAGPHQYSENNTPYAAGGSADHQLPTGAKTTTINGRTVSRDQPKWREPSEDVLFQESTVGGSTRYYAPDAWVYGPQDEIGNISVGKKKP